MSRNLFSVRDKIAIITGGTGQLGRQFSAALAERGARVAVFDIRPDGEEVLNKLAAQLEPDRLLYAEVDVTRRASIEAGLARVEAHWGPPEGLVNCAALDSPPGADARENGPFETYPEESWDRVMEVNAKGVFLCCQVIGGRMAETGSGSIINIGSIYGLVSPDQRIYEHRRRGGETFFKPVAYSASKSALLNLTRYLATYWAERGVRVNALSFAGVFNEQDEEFIASYRERVPLGRMACEDEYNGAVIFALSDASSYMTGSNLVIDGGWTAW